MTEHAHNLGLGLPEDILGWTALVLGLLIVAVALGVRPSLRLVSRRVWVLTWAAIAAGLSAAYVHHYLFGYPRIIDATSYWLEGRGFASGLLSWPATVPSASFRGRFLLLSGAPGGPLALGVIFPPGYPALLAVGFILRCPMAIGPVLAAALVVVTEALAREITERDDVAKLAAVASAFCACLRYHTADTMSHGLAALCLAAAVLFGLRSASAASPQQRILCAAACGWCGGWLLATRPASAVALAVAGLVVCCVSLIRARARVSLELGARLAALTMGAVLPVLLLLVHQHAVSGQWLESSQGSYYAVSDGPPGCFRYGFGAGIGCLVEHAPYVTSVLPHGHSFGSAWITTARRLHLHLSDIGNTELAVVLVLIGAWVSRRSLGGRLAAAIPAALVLVYVPFYFDGSYPGGGARLFADALPLEHVLLALAICRITDKLIDGPRGHFAGLAGLMALQLVGFAVRASHEHIKLRERDGGRPFYDEAAIVSSLGSDPRGLLLVDSDHAFNLAHNPSITNATTGLVVARARHDDRDTLLWQRLGRPIAWEATMAPWTPSARPARVEPWSPPRPDPSDWRFEAEAEWPPLEQSGGYAVPTFLAPNSCVSAGAALALIRTGAATACVTIEVPFPSAGSWNVMPSFVVDGDVSVRVVLVQDGRELVWSLPEHLDVRRWPDAEKSETDGRFCVRLPPLRVSTQKESASLKVCSVDRWVAVDSVRLFGPSRDEH